MDSDQLWDTTMNPETRILKAITLEDIDLEETEKIVTTLMGIEVEPRRSYIINNSKLAKLDI